MNNGMSEYECVSSLTGGRVPRIQRSQPVAEAVKLLEESQIQWRRDFDAVLIGWIIGALMGILSTVAVLVALK